MENHEPKTLRDEFATAALTGMLAQPQEPGSGRTQKYLAAIAYQYADVMLEARSK